MADGPQFVRIGERRLRVTNLDKVVYPETGTTKGEVIDYYARIAPHLLPVVAGRPVTRKRWVEGVGTAADPQGSFFAKQLEPGAPGWIPRQEIPHSGGAKDYPLVDEVATLVWMAQVAAIELHIPQWRFAPDGGRGDPDRLVLDLDPGPGVSLAQCAEVALLARGILTGMGLDAVPVTSGSKGIHLYAHLPGDRTSDEISAFAHALARAIEADRPDFVTSVMTKTLRAGKVFLDWSQNNGKKTTIAPYSLRGRPQPWVAAPRTWAELEDPDLRQLRFDEVLDRAENGLDPFATITGAPIRGADHRFGARPVTDSVRDAPQNELPRPKIAAVASEPVLVYSPMLAEHGTPGTARGLGWAEIKWDGIRAIGTWSEGRFRLRARSGTDITDRYPELTADGAPGFPVGEAVVDGEIVALDAAGRPSFHRLQDRMHLTRAREIEREVVRTPVRYHLFDLLHLEGHDLTALPLRDRRELLEQIAADLPAPVLVPPVFDDVDAALATSAALDLEGVVVKDPASSYASGGRSPRWLKIKLTRAQEVVIVGIRPGKGDRAGRIGSLLLAIPEPSLPSGLRYVGRVGTGFTDRTLQDLGARLEVLRIPSPAVDGVPVADASDALWVRPELVGEVEFANWTDDGVLRHSRWRGLRPDKRPDEVVVES
ncbi:MAG: non-homologous end-joining DNA ligase [Microbacterium sp.]|jgi:bifunctional non-homologous end joining protein LigD|uniref:non-homologous end-joining DNA ligase n=1 Tax=Microbacterium sp. TaxID=51671 RepID=UPI0028306E6F|nr:non-homologous end-joining DNA ligase [Microbacterium sp.]MDR2320377.1 non-homologous end-joining DNA ligase [Microbacterium sp.]